ESDPVNLRRLLRLRAERRRERPKRQHAKERAPVHHTRTTTSAIRRIGHLGGDGWRESSRRRRIAGVGHVGQASSARRLIAAPPVHVIHTRSPSTPPSSSPQYWCSWKKA